MLWMKLNKCKSRVHYSTDIILKHRNDTPTSHMQLYTQFMAKVVSSRYQPHARDCSSVSQGAQHELDLTISRIGTGTYVARLRLNHEKANIPRSKRTENIVNSMFMLSAVDVISKEGPVTPHADAHCFWLVIAKFYRERNECQSKVT
jgi:hypothetical protein